MNGSLGVAAGLGAVTGLRSMLALAWVSRELHGRRRRYRRPRRLESWLGDAVVSRALTALAAGELIADKLPAVPERIQPGSLVGRQAIGALLGAVAAGQDCRWAGAAVGASAALAGSVLGYWLRREAVRATLLPDAAIALVEDAITLAATRELATEL